MPYSIPAPAQGDVLSDALRRAYREPLTEAPEFDDLLHILNWIELN